MLYNHPVKNVYIALDNVRSLYNVGSVMRTCSFFGLKKVILIGYSGTKFNFKGEKILHPKLEKTALGAEQDVEVTFIENSEELLWFAKDENLKIVSIEQDTRSKDFDSWKPEENSILVLGNEVTGVSHDILEISEDIIEIKRIGKKHSLNVATAAGLLIHKVAK